MLEWKKQNDFSEKQTITKETINHTETYIAITPFGNLCISRSIVDLGNGKAINLPYGFYFEGNLIDRSSLDYDSVMKLATDWYTERAEMVYNKLQSIKSQEAKTELESYNTDIKDQEVISNQNQPIDDNKLNQQKIIIPEAQGGSFIVNPKLA